MYSKENISIEQDDLQDTELVLGRGLKEREKNLKEWLSTRREGNDNVDAACNGCSVSILPPKMAIESTDLGNLVLPVLLDVAGVKKEKIGPSSFLGFPSE